MDKGKKLYHGEQHDQSCKRKYWRRLPYFQKGSYSYLFKFINQLVNIKSNKTCRKIFFQIGYALGLIILASIVIVGLLVYYVGVMSVTSSLDASSSCLSTTAADPTTSKPATEKVKLTKRQSHFLRFIDKSFERIKITLISFFERLWTYAYHHI